MSSQIISRLLWKETRAQLHVWVALLCGAWLLQLAWFAFPYNVQRHYELYPYIMAMVVVVCQASACAGLMFAGEREDDTHRLLQSLPMRPFELLTGKLLYAVLSTALLYVVLSATTWVMFPATHAAWRNGTIGTELVQNLVGWRQAALLVTLFSLTLLASLWMRSVMASLLIGGGMLLALSVLLYSLFPRKFVDNETHLAFLLMPVVAVLAFTRAVTLVPGWLTDRPARWLPRRARSTAASRHWPQFAFPGWLRWSALRGTPASRAASVLVWREIRTAFPAALGWTPVGVCLPFVTLMLLQLAIEGANVLIVIFIGGLLVTPLLAGLATFHRDQRGNTAAFLADRGVSPALAWFAKQAVWLPAAIAVSAVLFWSSLVFPSRDGDSVIFWCLREMTRINTPLSIYSRVPYYEATPAALGLSLFGSAFAWGQLCSLWIKRPILRLVAALAGLAVSMFWHSLCTAFFGIPLWLATGPLILAAFAATFFTVSPWIRQERSWRVFRRKAAWLVLPLAATFAAIGVYRVASVPTVNPGFDWRAHEAKMMNFDPGLSGEWRRFLLAPLAAEAMDAEGNPTEIPAWPQGASGPFGAEYLDVSPLTREEIADKLIDLADRSTRSANARIDPALAASPTWSINVQLKITLALDRAESLLAAGQLDRCWTLLQASLTAADFLAGQSIQPSMPATNRALNLVRDWSQHPRQTAESLSRAGDYLTSISGRLPERESLLNHYVIARQALEHRAPGAQWRLEITGRRRFVPIPIVNWVEEQRALKVLNMQMLSLLDTQHFRSGTRTTRDTVLVSELLLLVATTPALNMVSGLAYSVLRADPSIPDRFDYSLRERVADLTATQLLVALERYRLERGQYPDSLAALVPRYLPTIPTDPWKGGAWNYEPRGLPLPLVTMSNSQDRHWEIIPAGQPLLWTSGSSGAVPRLMDVVPEERQVLPARPISGQWYQQMIANQLTPELPSELVDENAVPPDVGLPESLQPQPPVTTDLMPPINYGGGPRSGPPPARVTRFFLGRSEHNLPLPVLTDANLPQPTDRIRYLNLSN